MPDKIKSAVSEGYIQVGHAKSILTLSENHMISLFNDIISKNISVRQTEKLVKNFKFEKKIKFNETSHNLEKIKEIEFKLSNIFAMPVNIKCNKDGSCKAELMFDSVDDFSCIVFEIESKCKKPC